MSMPVVEVSQISKNFGPVKAVDEVSFSVEQGEIFALLGPNGAGKTTTIRIMLDIYRADKGKVSIFDGPMTEAKKDRIGYMPEERGLYQDLPLERVLVYLASLKGVSADQARRRASAYLERFDLEAYKQKKVKELSKGMQQKAQIIATLLHQPDLVIIDEPFSGLDPVNTQVVKDLLLELHRQKVTIIMSTHQMHQVEELCDRILLINHGKVMLYGELEQIRRRYAGNAVLVRAGKPLPPGLPGVLNLAAHNAANRLTLSPGVSPQDLLRSLVNLDIPLEQFEIAVPTLDEIFIRVVKGEGDQA
ncbi:MAG: ABC transporter ATP-binding protein [Omnitrophica WOR_2 bacterium]